ncbi:MAG: CYTH domain-containing protein [Flavisolibacter sp.]
MAIEIERKFLVDTDLWNKSMKGVRRFYRQGYISTEPGKTIRVRVNDENGFITIKGKPLGMSRSEYEYRIPKQDAIEMLDQFCSSVVAKYRYMIPFGGKIWEVDEFMDDNEGLIVAEIELGSEDEKFEKPEWVGEEVTGIEKYYNANLSKLPFKQWR